MNSDPTNDFDSSDIEAIKRELILFNRHCDDLMTEIRKNITDQITDDREKSKLKTTFKIFIEYPYSLFSKMKIVVGEKIHAPKDIFNKVHDFKQMKDYCEFKNDDMNIDHVFSFCGLFSANHDDFGKGSYLEEQ